MAGPQSSATYGRQLGIQKLLEVEKYSVSESSSVILGKTGNPIMGNRRSKIGRGGWDRVKHIRIETGRLQGLEKSFEPSFVICGGSSVKGSRRTY
jgi:hypothetical protein